ncbi:MAG: tetratricopeptide repeat protein [Planctomycetaceae bacterium]|nr:tetratricopeptide repeat protein [Planctomycetaceae bacterium]
MTFTSRKSIAKRSAAACLALGMAVALAGCASFPWPKTVTDGDVAQKQKKRSEDFNQYFDQQRDFAEYQAAEACWLQQRDSRGCRERLEKLLARRPRHREARLLMVEVLLAENQPDAAYRHAKAALDAYPNDAQSHYAMALSLDAQGKLPEATAYYERATKMDPQNATFAAAYQTAREANHQVAGPLKATSIGDAPDNDAQGSEGRPTAYEEPESGRRRPTPAHRADYAENAGDAPSAESPQNDPVAEQLWQGQAALAENNPTAAVEHFRQAVAMKPDNPQIPIAGAAALLRANQPNLAAELLRPAAKHFDRVPAVHRMLGAALYRMGDYRAAQVSLQQALSLDKSDALSYLLMGYTLAKLGQADNAEAHFRQARTLDPRYQAVR